MNSFKWCVFYKDNVWIISLCYETGALKSKQPRIFDVIKTLVKAKQQYVLSCTLQRRMTHRYSISKNCQQDANVYGLPVGQNELVFPRIKVLHLLVTSRWECKMTNLLHQGHTEKKTATFSVPFYLITCLKCFWGWKKFTFLTCH